MTTLADVHGVVDFARRIIDVGAVGARVVAASASHLTATLAFGIEDIEAFCLFSPPAHVQAVRLIFFGRAVDRASYLDASGYYDFATIARLHQGGATISANEVHLWSGSVHHVKTQLEQLLHCSVGVNCYVTPPDSQGLDTHVDAHDVIVIQLEGRKRWQLFERAPMVGGRYTMDGFSQTHPPSDRILEPGDLLYVPAGFAHNARAVAGGTSVHVTVGFTPPSWKTLMQACVETSFETSPALSGVIPPAMLQPDAPGPEFTRLAVLAREAVGVASLDDARRRVINYRAPSSYPAFVPDEVPTAGSISPHGRFRKAAGSRGQLFAGRLELRHGSGRPLALKSALAPAWALIDGQDTVTPSDLAPLVPAERAPLFCRYLLGNGLIVRAEASTGRT